MRNSGLSVVLSIVHLLVSGYLMLVVGKLDSESPQSAMQIAWPDEFEGRVIVQIDLSPLEAKYAKSFPGKMGRFTDGDRELVFRYIDQATRKLHPVAHCLKGTGYKVSPAPIKVGRDGKHWGCITASNRKAQEKEKLLICERIYDKNGKNYSDVSAWYWAAVLGDTKGPWWSVTVAESM